jgi:CHAD domain-containing protein
MRTTVERELKLAAGADFELPELEGEPLAERIFTSTYYDTPTGSLAQSGITLRRRLENRRSAWQLKLPRPGDARAEIEARGGSSGPPPDLAALLVAHLRHGALEQVAALRTHRRGVRVTDGGRALADLTLDEVDVLDGKSRIDGFAEVEIELVDGEADDLERLGRELRAAGARRSDGTPKVFRVLGIERQTAPPREASAHDLLVHQLHRQLVQLETYDPGVRLGGEPEDVHKFRVATRRSRALIRATRPLLGDRLAPLAQELGWLAGLLGPVRDLDVLLEHLVPEVDRLGPDAEGGAAILAALAEEREARRGELLAGLQSERYLRLLDSFAAEIQALPRFRGRLTTLAADELKRLRKAARETPAAPSDEQLHALRIRTKRARYAAELAALADGKKFARYVDALTAVQDAVGEHQDAVVAEWRLRQLASGERAIAAGRLIEREQERREATRERYPKLLAEALERGRAALS